MQLVYLHICSIVLYLQFTNLNPNSMNGKGLTPEKLQYRILTERGELLQTSEPITGVSACVDAINKQVGEGYEVSYYKAFRGIKEYGVYTCLVLLKADQQLAKDNMCVALFAAAPGHEVRPQYLMVQQPATALPAPLFEVGSGTEDIVSLAALAKDINKHKPAPAPKPVKQAKAAKPVVKLTKFYVEFYKFTEDGHKYELSTRACIRAATKKVARDVVREMLSKKRIQVLHVEPAPRNARVDTKLMY